MRSVIFLGKAGDVLCGRAAAYLEQHFMPIYVNLGKRDDPFPAIDSNLAVDYIISYLSPWIVPTQVLRTARHAAINFHPGPPEYPGIGCTNFALYEEAPTYGVTCHHMDATVDTGPIIRVIRFPVYRSDTVQSLTERSYTYLSWLFYEIVDLIISDKPLTLWAEQWTRRPFRRSELHELCHLKHGMSEDEIRRRIRATTFPGYPGASFEWEGFCGQDRQSQGEVGF